MEKSSAGSDKSVNTWNSPVFKQDRILFHLYTAVQFGISVSSSDALVKLVQYIGSEIILRPGHNEKLIEVSSTPPIYHVQPLRLFTFTQNGIPVQQFQPSPSSRKVHDLNVFALQSNHHMLSASPSHISARSAADLFSDKFSKGFETRFKPEHRLK